MQARLGDGANVAMVGTAAASENGQTGKQIRQVAVVPSQVVWVALIEYVGGVQFRVTHARGVGADAGDASSPCAVFERVLEMRRMRTVNHEAGRRALCQAIDQLDGLPQWLPAGQPSVGLDGERHDRRSTGSPAAHTTPTVSAT